MLAARQGHPWPQLTRRAPESSGSPVPGLVGPGTDGLRTGHGSVAGTATIGTSEPSPTAPPTDPSFDGSAGPVPGSVGGPSPEALAGPAALVCCHTSRK